MDRDAKAHGDAQGRPPSRPLLPAPVWAALATALALITAWLVFFMPPGAPGQDFAGDVPGLDEDLFDGGTGAPDTAAQLARLREMVPPDERAMANPVEPTPQVLNRARSIFGSQCAVCHGPQGDANVPVARTLNPPPVDFTHPAFAEMEPGATYYIIRHGSPGTGMPAFGQAYSDEEIWALVHFLRLNFAAVERRTETVPPARP
ncbi:MAG TPA: c-type cytochrome [Limnochordales bacterium]|nr:c-type cytochrome [Limnochordales bacterium]